MRIDWEMRPDVLGLTFLSVSPGFTQMGSAEGTREEKMRACVESFLIGVVGVMVTHSWWPLVGPLAYAAFDQAWDRMYPDGGDE